MVNPEYTIEDVLPELIEIEEYEFDILENEFGIIISNNFLKILSGDDRVKIINNILYKIDKNDAIIGEYFENTKS